MSIFLILMLVLAALSFTFLVFLICFFATKTPISKEEYFSNNKRENKK